MYIQFTVNHPLTKYNACAVKVRGSRASSCLDKSDLGECEICSGRGHRHHRGIIGRARGDAFYRWRADWDRGFLLIISEAARFAWLEY